MKNPLTSSNSNKRAGNKSRQFLSKGGKKMSYLIKVIFSKRAPLLVLGKTKSFNTLTGKLLGTPAGESIINNNLEAQLMLSSAAHLYNIPQYNLIIT